MAADLVVVVMGCFLVLGLGQGRVDGAGPNRSSVTVRALDRATRIATEAGNDAVACALDAARATLAPTLIELGLRMPEPRARGKRRGKAGQAA